jgi:hypothetical protein
MPAAKISISKVQSDDRIINQLQQNIITGVDKLQDQVINSPSNGVFITTTLKTGANTITHSLQAVPTSFIITDINFAATIYRTLYTKSTVTLNSSAPGTITFYLF